MNTVTEAAKLASETITLKFDFLSRLQAGETVATSVCEAEVFTGTDATPANIISGTSSISGDIVSQKITAGEDGVIYQVTCACRTTDNNIYLLRAKVAVLPDVDITPAALP
jgi:hypothetical protein